MGRWAAVAAVQRHVRVETQALPPRPTSASARQGTRVPHAAAPSRPLPRSASSRAPLWRSKTALKGDNFRLGFLEYPMTIRLTGGGNPKGTIACRRSHWWGEVVYPLGGEVKAPMVKPEFG